MNVNLQPHQEQAIMAAIKEGRFRSLEEFIESAVRILTPIAEPSLSGQSSTAMTERDGLWVHCGEPESGAHWDTTLTDLREERLSQFTQLPSP